MKKIGIVSCYFHPNYGSALQAYATQRILDQWKIPCEHIQIAGVKRKITARKILFCLKHFYSPQIWRGTVLRMISRMLRKKIDKEFRDNLSVRQKCFQQFQENYFRLSEQAPSDKNLPIYVNNYSHILLGSDQLWLPANIEADYYTLNWVPKEIPKIAYAASFGVEKLPHGQKKKVKNFANRFDKISVREKSGKKILQEWAGLDVSVVCDPTILFTGQQWMEIQQKKPIISEPYILCYFLGNNTEDREFAVRMKQKTKLPLVALLHLDEYVKTDNTYADYTPYAVGPAELLNLIYHASYVITDSFHGSVFSLLYHKLFFTSPRVRKEGMMCTNTRIDSLFSMVGVDNRWIMGDEDVQECLNRKIDYTYVDKRMETARKQGHNFLRDALL